MTTSKAILISVLAVLLIHTCYGNNSTGTNISPNLKAASFEDIAGKYYVSHKIFDFCADELDVEVSGTTITSLMFDGWKTPCGTGDIDTKIYPGGERGWAIAMGQRVQGKLGITCDDTPVSIMITRAEMDYRTEKPLWGTENKYYNYQAGLKYLTFAQDNVGTCVYSDRQLDPYGNLPETPESTSSDVPDPDNRISIGAIVGIVVGVIVIILLIVGAIVFFIRRKKKMTDDGVLYERNFE